MERKFIEIKFSSLELEAIIDALTTQASRSDLPCYENRLQEELQEILDKTK